MHCQADIGECILHFGAIVEAESTHQLVAHAPSAEYLFDSARLEIDAVLDCARLVRIVIQNTLELTSDKFRFALRSARVQVLQIRSLTLLLASGPSHSPA